MPAPARAGSLPEGEVVVLADGLEKSEGLAFSPDGRMFVTAGENIYPGDVETMLERHPDVMQAVVVPAPNTLKAHVPHAFIVPKTGADLTEDAVKQHALANAPAYAHPRRVFFMDVLPLAGTNKIDRKLLKEQAADAAKADGTA